MGNLAGKDIIGAYNTILGHGACENTGTIGNLNVLVGRLAGQEINNATQNNAVMVGSASLGDMTTGDASRAVGVGD